ncbi:hypothetical protein KY289_008160 [Solanum tuberosum]|nr:hypothetical protein KY289_008160 [Solanum tuberosum]
MARPKHPIRGPTPRKKEEAVVIALEVTPPHATQSKPTLENVKGKGKKHVVESSRLSLSSSDNMGIDTTHLTSSNFEW